MQTQTKVDITRINIPKYITIGRLIGREGCNLKPITEETGTYINVNTETRPAQLEIRLNNKITLLSSKDRVKEASDKLKNLMKKIEHEMKNHQKDTKKKVNNNIRHGKDNHYEKSRRWKENNLKREERK
jgi:hypothetical protein